MFPASSRVASKIETILRDFPDDSVEFAKIVADSVKCQCQLTDENCPKNFLVSLLNIYNGMLEEEKYSFKHTIVRIFHAIALCGFSEMTFEDLTSLLSVLNEVEPNFLKMYFVVKVAMDVPQSVQTRISERIDKKSGVWKEWGNGDTQKYSEMIPGFANSSMREILKKSEIEKKYTERIIMDNIKQSLLGIISRSQPQVLDRESMLVNPSDVMQKWDEIDKNGFNRRCRGIFKYKIKFTSEKALKKYKHGLEMAEKIVGSTRDEDIVEFDDVMQQLIAIWTAADGGNPFEKAMKRPISYEAFSYGDDARSQVYVVTMREILVKIWSGTDALEYHTIKEVKNEWFGLFKVRDEMEDWDDIFETVLERTCMCCTTSIGFPPNMVITYQGAYLLYIVHQFGKFNLFDRMMSGMNHGDYSLVTKFQRSILGYGEEACEKMFLWMKGDPLPDEWLRRFRAVGFI